MKPIKAFPKMIYHETDGNRVVLNEQELRTWLDKGWSTTRVDYDVAKDLKAQIEKAEDNLRIMKMKLAAIEGINDVKIDVPVIEEKPTGEISPIFPRKRGRGQR